MKPLTRLVFSFSALLSCVASPVFGQASVVDFSTYTTGQFLGQGATTGTGSTQTSPLAVTLEGGAFVYKGRTANNNSVSTFQAQILTTTGVNRLNLTDSYTSGAGRPYNYVQSANAFTPTVGNQLVTYSTDFRINTMGNGQLNFGLYSAAQGVNGYNLNQTLGSTGMFNDTAIGLSMSFNSAGIRVNRTGSDNGQHVETFVNSTGLWTDGTANIGGGVNWATDVVYRATVSMNTDTGLMTISLINTDTSATVFSVSSSFADLGSQASVDGFKFAFGNLESNSAFGWDLDILSITESISMIPEPSSAAMLLGGLVLGGVAVRRRRRRE